MNRANLHSVQMVKCSTGFNALFLSYVVKKSAKQKLPTYNCNLRGSLIKKNDKFEQYYSMFKVTDILFSVRVENVLDI